MRRARVLLVALGLAVAACGGSTVPKERALTQEEADRLASVLYTNYESKGAAFEITTAFTSTNDTLSMQGIVDWANHRGRALVTARGMERGISEIVWSDSVVIERRPALDGPLSALGFPDARFVARPPDPSKRQIDRAISILMGLASTVRENAVLILQKQGSAWMRTDTWRGKPVDVLRYGTQNRFWLEPGTSTLRRFDGNAAAGSAPIVIDFASFGPQNVPAPDGRSIVGVDSVRELYESAVAG